MYKFPLFYLFLFATQIQFGFKQDKNEIIEKLTVKWNSRLNSSRYMYNNVSCDTLYSYTGWENLPVIKCKYSVAGISATVVMLNANTKQIATWIVNACYETGHADMKSMDKLFAQVINQSGGQFPIAGIVLEDMDRNGKPSNYCFRNGVTVSIRGLFVGSTRFPEKQATQAEIDMSLQGEIEHVYKYARIISTTREDYVRYSGKPMNEINGNKWATTVAQLYKTAWNSDRNELITAWAKSNL